MSQVSVSLERKGPLIELDFESLALERIRVRQDTLPPDERSGGAQKLLCASVCWCYAAALDHALKTRGMSYDSISAQAAVRAEKVDGQSRITGMELDVELALPEEYRPRFGEISEAMRGGCMVSASLETAFPMKYNLVINGGL